MIKLFLLLQVLDFATTIIGFRLGIGEGIPAVRLMIYFGGPVVGVLFSKLLAVALLVISLALHKPRIIKWANCWYTALVGWNIGCILYILFHHGPTTIRIGELVA